MKYALKGRIPLLQTGCCSLNNEDRELQIRLAQLQTDIQTYLTINVSFVAILFAFIIGFQQLSAQATEAWRAIIYLAGMVAMVVLSIFVTKRYVDKMVEKRKEMDELKKQYVW